ncbi:MAG TPA: radical SAM protein [Planctomycetota bacterium]|nr:radical SAM protein [Planctomycetota bacterium]
MNLTSRLLRAVRPWLRRHDSLKRFLQDQEQRFGRWRHEFAQRFPRLIRPTPRQITIAITAACNLRCIGCRYGRDFMVGEQLDVETVLGCLDDAAAAGVATARFYGGEPLLHRDLPRMIAHALELGMDAYVTTNATLLGDRIDELHAAGLRWLTIGFYGIGQAYDSYTQREGHFDKLQRSLETVRARCGDAIAMQMNYMLSRRSCHVDDVRAAWQLVTQYDLHLGVDPVSRTIPFFRVPGDELSIPEEMRPELLAVAAEFERLKTLRPDRVVPSRTFLRMLPALLLEDAASTIPCDAYELLWVGADGTVQLCDTAFPLGSLKEKRLRDILFTEKHCRAARDGFALKCPTCMCKIDSRIRRHRASVRQHGQ